LSFQASLSLLRDGELVIGGLPGILDEAMEEHHGSPMGAEKHAADPPIRQIASDTGEPMTGLA
jgi:hypothetical protein